MKKQSESDRFDRLLLLATVAVALLLGETVAAIHQLLNPHYQSQEVSMASSFFIFCALLIITILVRTYLWYENYRGQPVTEAEFTVTKTYNRADPDPYGEGCEIVHCAEVKSPDGYFGTLEVPDLSVGDIVSVLHQRARTFGNMEVRVLATA